MKTSIFIKLTSTLALIAFVMMAFSSCQQAGRNYQKGNFYNKSNTVKTYQSGSSGRDCSGGT